MFNPSEMVSKTPLFQLIDQEEKAFYRTLVEKNIEPRSLADLERIISVFNSSTSNIDNHIKNEKNMPKELLNIISARVTIDIIAILAEKYSLDPYQVPGYLGEDIHKRFMEAQKTFM